MANRMGCNNVVADGDSLEIIQACTGEGSWWGESSAIFADCVDLVATIGRVNFQHCLRGANEVAHELARSCFSERISCNWVDEPPSFIMAKLINDVT